jgi:hypothetical protein
MKALTPLPHAIQVMAVKHFTAACSELPNAPPALDDFEVLMQFFAKQRHQMQQVNAVFFAVQEIEAITPKP